MLLAPCAYAGRLGLTAWRRKSTILIGIFLLGFVIFGVHYNMGFSGNSLPESDQKNSFESIRHSAEGYHQVGVEDRRTEDNKDSVKFVQNKDDLQKVAFKPESSPVLMLNENSIQHLQQPSRDEIAKRRANNNLVINEDINQGAYEMYANQGLLQMGIPFVNFDPKNLYIPDRRVVHIDLKGAPPKMSYLKRLFPILKTLGATGLLLEYEDMFPFTGTLSDIKAKNAYTKDQVQDLLKSAMDNDLEVIPLVQTFGHLEFALKREGFAHLREVPESPQALCPSLNKSLEFVESMINQVLDLHSPNVKYLHIGCDEVFQMGECPRCRKELGSISRDGLFLNHVQAVINLLSKRWPYIRPIFWDDMLRHVPQRDILESGIGQKIDPMVWVYAEDIYRFVPTHVWDKYAAVFPSVWSASAYKGAFGETQYVPNARRHLENNLRWLEVMNQEGPKFKNGFTGIALTGWQRYDHFAVLCELLPAAIPSLAINLIATTRGHFDINRLDEVNSALGCPTQSSAAIKPPLSLNTDPNMWDKFSHCFFPGNLFFKLTYRLHVAETEAKEYVEQTRKLKGWMTLYNIKHNYSAPLRVNELTADLPRILRTLTTLSRAAVDALSDFCDQYTIAEWVEQRIYPDILELEKIQNISQQLLSWRVWDRRPLPPLEDLKRLGISLPENEHH